MKHTPQGHRAYTSDRVTEPTCRLVFLVLRAYPAHNPLPCRRPWPSVAVGARRTLKQKPLAIQ